MNVNALASIEQQRPATVVSESWKRCLNEYRLDPEKVRAPDVVSSYELKQQLAPHEEFLASSQQEIEQLFRRLVDNDYIVSVASSEGLKLFLRCDHLFLGDMSSFGVLPGSIWREDTQGTNGIGTALRVGKAVSINGDDHFGVHNKLLSCHAVPIFGRGRTIEAVLNVTCVHSESDRTARLVQDILGSSALRVESRYFARRNEDHRILRVSADRDFANLESEVRLAIDDSGEIVDVSSNAIALVGSEQFETILGSHVEDVFDLPAGWERTDATSRVSSPLDSSIAYLSHLTPKRNPTSTRRSTGTTAQSSFPSVVYARSGLETSPVREELEIENSELLLHFKKTEQLFRAGLPVSLVGESGTGKTSLARSLAETAVANVLTLNCANLGQRSGDLDGQEFRNFPENTVLVLEGLSDLSDHAQATLVAFLADESWMQRRRISLISTASKSVSELMQKGFLREDLGFRLDGALLECPPLRAYANLEAQIVSTFRRVHGRTVSFQREASVLLNTYHWPGNLRELERVARHAAVLSDGPSVRLNHLPEALVSKLARENMTAKTQAQASRIEAALEHHRGNVSETAKYLGISRSTLYRKIQIRDVR